MFPFDPVRSHEFWLRGHLKDVIDREPFPPERKSPALVQIYNHAYAEMRIVDFISAFLFGFPEELKPASEKHIAWMESQPEPDRGVYAKCGLSAERWREALFSWRLVLGMCKWLSRGDRAFGHLTAATAADWQLVALVKGEDAPEVRASRRAQMSLHLATALAADAPLLGVKNYEDAGMKSPMGPATSPVRFGYWACRQLLGDGTRDEAFVARGEAMLTANLLPIFFAAGNMIEAALWLKIIYFDSGAVQTPEQAFAKAYDSMPGISRPDFISA